MQIAIISDVHDNLWALADLLPRLATSDALLCLGDYCAPFTMSAIGEGFSGPVHVVFGNNDGDRVLLSTVAAEAGNVTVHGQYAELTLGGRLIAMTHLPEIASAIAAGERHDLVCHGHNHQRKQTSVGRTILLDPGEVMARFGVCSYGTYDTCTGAAEIHEWHWPGNPSKHD